MPVQPPSIELELNPEDLLTEECIDYAWDYVEAFARVNASRPSEVEKQESIATLLESLGLTPELNAHFQNRLHRFAGADEGGRIMLGVLVGLFINQRNSE